MYICSQNIRLNAKKYPSIKYLQYVQLKSICYKEIVATQTTRCPLKDYQVIEFPFHFHISDFSPSQILKLPSSNTFTSHHQHLDLSGGNKMLYTNSKGYVKMHLKCIRMSRLSNLSHKSFCWNPLLSYPNFKVTYGELTHILMVFPSISAFSISYPCQLILKLTCFCAFSYWKPSYMYKASHPIQ